MNVARSLLQASTLVTKPVRLIRARRFKDPALSVSSKKHEKIRHSAEKQESNSTNITVSDTKIGGNVFEDSSLKITNLSTEEDADSVKIPKPPGKVIAENMRKNKRESNKDCFSGMPIFSRMNYVELAKMLRKNVLYADKDLVILSKPYGLSVHDCGDSQLSLKSSLPFLSKMIYGINTSIPLHICNRLDKGTTGVTVCAANRDLHHEIVKLFRLQRVRRKYWAVTVDAPSPNEGIIDIPLTIKHLSEKSSGKNFCKMSLAPEKRLDWRSGDMVKVRPREAHVAMTHYRLLDQNEGLAFLELQPFTTVKHQLRVHMAEGLRCPILGDHKYSRYNDLAPQTLPKKVLTRLNVKRSKTRDICMHLHLREILIPGIFDGDSKPSLLVSAKPPMYMHQTVKMFKMKPGIQSEFKYPPERVKKNPPHVMKGSLDELYHDPSAGEKYDVDSKKLQRDDCYTVYKPQVRVKFQPS